MNHGRLKTRLRTAIVGAAASALICMGVGCTSEDTGEPNTANPNVNAAPASATSSGVQSDQFQVSRAFPTGSRSTSDLLVDETGPREVRVGRPYTYRVRVTNLTDQQLTGVALREHLSDNFNLSEAGDVQRGQDGKDARINIGDLGPRQSKTIEMTGTPTHEGTFDSCLSAQYNPPTLCARLPIVAPAIKTVVEAPSQIDVCQDIGYRYTVTNTGTGTAHNVVLQGRLPDGLRTADGRDSLSVNVGDLGQGQSKSVLAHLRATQPGQFSTRAVVNSDVGQVQTEPAVIQVLAPRLAVSITAPKEQVAGENLSYRIEVKNVGDAAAAHSRLRIGATPGQVEFMNAEGGAGNQLASENPNGGQDLGTIAPNESRVVTVNFRPRQGGANAFDATAQADCAQPVTTSVNTQFKSITASALIVTHDPDPVVVGNNVVYHLAVQNKGTDADHNIQITATLPDSEQFVSGNGKTDVRNDGQNITFGPIADLQPKQTVQWDVVVKAIRPDEANFKASMTSQATPTPASKIEPTKLFGGSTEKQTQTNVAPEPTKVNAQPATPANQQ